MTSRATFSCLDEHLHGSWRPRPFGRFLAHVCLVRIWWSDVMLRAELQTGQKVAFGVSVPLLVRISQSRFSCPPPRVFPCKAATCEFGTVEKLLQKRACVHVGTQRTRDLLPLSPVTASGFPEGLAAPGHRPARGNSCLKISLSK